MTYFEAAENIAKILHEECAATIREAVDSATTLITTNAPGVRFTFGDLVQLEANVAKGFQT